MSRLVLVCLLVLVLAAMSPVLTASAGEPTASALCAELDKQPEMMCGIHIVSRKGSSEIRIVIGVTVRDQLARWAYELTRALSFFCQDSNRPMDMPAFIVQVVGDGEATRKACAEVFPPEPK